MSPTARLFAGFLIMVPVGVIAIVVSWQGMPITLWRVAGLLVLAVLGALPGAVLALWEERLEKKFPTLERWVGLAIAISVGLASWFRLWAGPLLQVAVVSAVFGSLIAFILLRFFLIRRSNEANGH